ncbi:hypothetical protein V8F20_011980 [Naviculisporaceae sp. PSN 640]
MSANKPNNDNDKNENESVVYDHSNYKFIMFLLPDGKKGEIEQNAKWFLTIRFYCHDLGKLMREGLWWSYANIVPELGSFREIDPDRTLQRYTRQRYWVLRENSDKDESQVAWHGHIILEAKDYDTLGNVSLNHLSRNNIFSCTGFNRDGERIFYCEPNTSRPAINCLYEGLHPGNGSWWIWPMDRLDPPPPYANDVNDQANDGPVGYINKPEGRWTHAAEEQNISIVRQVCRALYRMVG